ncbi:MAG: tyrosine-type recombinase/integrase, partial [Lachnospiraceae bacterium]
MSTEPITYHQQSYIDNTLRLRELLTTMPSFVKDYFRAMEPTTSSKTRISYAYDIRVFFNFLIEQNPLYHNYTMNQFTSNDLEHLSPLDIEEYQEYLKVYLRDTKQVTNSEKGLARKMSALRSFYGYFYKRQIIEKNPTLLVDMPKLHDKAIVRLDTDEIVILLDYVEHCGDLLNGQQKKYYEKTKNRDLAILTLLLGTGIRVSECVGLDINDVDFKNNGIKVTRKGGNEMIVYFGNEVQYALEHYLEYTRNGIIPLVGYENALFLS